MPSNEEQIRNLIERWAEAVHAGDLPIVVANHADDIVMYDVPLPHQGVHGIDAYRDTWPGFEWQRMGASFEIESLDVVAGDDVAFAYALLRCGTAEEFADNPDNRLRLTLGLRKEDGRWIVAHEHHLFLLFDRAAAGEGEVRDVLRQWSESTAAQDLDGLMTPIADDVVSYEHEQPLQYVGRDAVREVCAQPARARPGHAGPPGPHCPGRGPPCGRVGPGPRAGRARRRAGDRQLVARHQGVRPARRQLADGAPAPVDPVRPRDG